MENSIRCARKARHISQETLAKNVGISRVHLSRIESGRAVPSVEIALRISGELGKEVGELFPAPRGEMETVHNKI